VLNHLRYRLLRCGVADRDQPHRVNGMLVYQYLITSTGVASGLIFFGELLSIEKIVGEAIILMGVYLARRR
jgi:drug/metabolite transporter (DMT)-like permease